MKRILFLFVCAFLTACAAVNLPPITGPSDFKLQPDEQRLWTRVEEEERDFDKTGVQYGDAELEKYLNMLARKLQPAATYEVIPFKIRVIKNPGLNAFALPNGVIYVHTGILARIENEAEFAALIGHEMTHVTHRHGVKKWRQLKKKSQIATVMGLNLGELSLMAAISAYSHEVETEADVESLKLVARAGYDTREAPKLFVYLKQEVEDEKIEDPFVYSSHPQLSARIENYEQLLGTVYKNQTGGAKNTEAFQKHMRKLILDNAWLDLQRGRFTTTERNMNSYVTKYPDDARGYYFLGELYRQKAGQGDDREKARRNYQKAISLDTKYPDPYKALGLLQYKQGDKKAAQQNMRMYLFLVPKAPDRAYLEEYVREGN